MKFGLFQAMKELQRLVCYSDFWSEHPGITTGRFYGVLGTIYNFISFFLLYRGVAIRSAGVPHPQYLACRHICRISLVLVNGVLQTKLKEGPIFKNKKPFHKQPRTRPGVSKLWPTGQIRPTIRSVYIVNFL